MIGSKMVLTYKRKRFSSRPGLGFENECPDQSPGCQTLQVLKTPVTKEEEEDSKHESERKDPEILNPCPPVYSGGNLVSVSGQVNNESSLEAVGSLPLKGKASNSCADTVRDNKPGFPLITFSRRSRHKKAVDVSGMQERSTVVEKDDLLVLTNASNTTIDNCGALTGNDPSQEKKTSEDVDLYDAQSLPVPKIKISEIPTSEDLITERCISKDTTLTPTTKPTSGVLPMDAICHVPILEDKPLEESECHVSAVDESRDGLESDGITTKKRDGGSLASFDLSKPPPEASGLVDCSLTLESSSNLQADNTHRDSTDSTSRSHSTVLHEFPSQQKALELLDERIGETPFSSQVHSGGPTLLSGSSTTHMWGPDLPSASISQSQTSKNNFLQLFPENDIFPLKKPSFINHEDKQPNRRHLHFRTSTPFGVPPWPTMDTPGAHYPSDPVSLMRHKIMLDNIISKARIVTGKKDGFDPRTAWSEDELDCLWIGVRRHGIGNWDSMLRDPRLRFAYSRSPRELAERWEEEHAKLLITKTPPQNKRPRPTASKKYEEPKLTLGSKGNLPHWLWEAVSVPPVERGAVSYTGCSGMMQWINQPFLGSAGPEVRAPGGGARMPGPGEVGGPHHRCGSVGKADEVIVINSDASSEETISDDHGRV